ncbi:MAG: hypothetical protein ACYC7E_10445 [Armatimonadota bacterium]
MKRFWQPWGIILVTALVSMLTPRVFCSTLEFLSNLIESFQHNYEQRFSLVAVMHAFFLWLWNDRETYLEFTLFIAIPAIVFAAVLQFLNKKPLTFLNSLFAATVFGIFLIAPAALLCMSVYGLPFPSGETLERFVAALFFGFFMGMLVNYRLNSRYWPPKTQQEPSTQPSN